MYFRVKTPTASLAVALFYQVYFLPVIRTPEVVVGINLLINLFF